MSAFNRVFYKGRRYALSTEPDADLATLQGLLEAAERMRAELNGLYERRPGDAAWVAGMVDGFKKRISDLTP